MYLCTSRVLAEDMHGNTEHILICGPRCVQSILDHYGQEVDLISLAKEMQGDIVETGCSLQDIEEALKRRGINCQALRAGALELPVWPHPIVVHFTQGHFIVLDKIDGLYAQIRDGPGMDPVWTFVPTVMIQQSGAVLLTSDSQIPDDAPHFLRWPRVFVGLCSIAVGTMILYMRRTTARRLMWLLLRHFPNQQKEERVHV